MDSTKPNTMSTEYWTNWHEFCELRKATKPSALEVARDLLRDAERYRFIRDMKNFEKCYPCWEKAGNLTLEEFDEVVDQAMGELRCHIQ